MAGLRDPAEPAGDTADCAGGALVPGLPSDPGGGGAGGGIAGTGFAPVLATMGAAVAMVVGAAVVVVARRRREREDGR